MCYILQPGNMNGFPSLSSNKRWHPQKGVQIEKKEDFPG
jgi:hypothetical protein